MSRTIPLTKGYVAIVDDDDYDDLMRWRWTACVRDHSVYVRRGEGGRGVYMHRYLMRGQLRAGDVVDHLDLNPLNNRRRNLRVCSQADNLINAPRHKDNTSGYKGVSLDKRRGAYAAELMVRGTRYRSNGHKTAEEAARWYDRMALLHQGAFARLNFPAAPATEMELDRAAD